MQTVDEALEKLSHSRFRSSFHLRKYQKEYIQDKGMEVIESHAREFVEKRLAPGHIANDGKQTPMKGHPVFMAQHATATCCRGCLYKWYHIPENTELTIVQQEKIVRLIMAWIAKEMGESNENSL